jgi:3,4-dihydroxy-2-butanone 4-phosphate synthase
VICEMLDSTTYRALSISKAENYANKAGIILLESDQLVKAYSKEA